MNIHAGLDELAFRFSALTMKGRGYFSEQYEGSRLTDLPGDTRVDLPEIAGEGYLQGKGFCGEIPVDPGVLIHRWVGPEAPLIIYHHGAAEGSFDFSFRNIFNRRLFRQRSFNLAAIKGPFCRTNGEYYGAVRDMKRYQALIAGSVLTIEKLIRHFRSVSRAPVCVAGTSLGGEIACLHSLLYDSADLYLPLLAGTDTAEIFLTSSYAVTCDPQVRREHGETLRGLLNFGEAFRAADNQKVYPVLARYDRLFLLEAQAPYFRAENLTILNRGHVTGGLSFSQIAAYLHRKTAGPRVN
ncbi:MAG: hypothetical protein JW760_15100 [Spirochaetales bacterium]|nr:hypothetical protein [Spirochaetales bacterium]